MEKGAVRMYFVDDHHAVNYKLTQIQWEFAQHDPEYAAACYLLAVPMVFEKIVFDLDEHDTPVDWMIQWEEDDSAYDLCAGAIELGRLALHLWNGSGPFHLLQCLESLQGHHYDVVKTAMDVRMGRAG